MAGFVVQLMRCSARTFIASQKSTSKLSASTGGFLQSISRSINTSRCLAAERLYTSKHEWISVEGKLGTVGISDYAQDALGDVVYAQLPDIGSEVSKDEECGALESVKAASELISPVSGLVVEKNESVEAKPGLINTSCYKDGWLYRVELSQPEELKGLMNEEEYATFLKTDPH